MAMGETRQGLPAGPVLAVAIGVAGLAACLTLLFLGMRIVMDVGGMCAEGGAYVIATRCPDGSAAATMIGVFGLFVFGGIGMWGGAKLGGAWQSLPGVGWVGLFGLLGWNFLDYGLLNPPPGETIVWGWLVPGVLFELMALVPAVMGIWMLRASGFQRAQLRRSGFALPLPGSGRADRAADERTPRAPSTPEEALAAIAQAMGSGISLSAAEPRGPEAGERPETTQGLLDRLERLAALRDRGLLSADDYETAKRAVMHDLEGRG